MSARVFSSSLRAAFRASASASRPTGRRMMSSAAPGAHTKSSDTPWIIGSAVVFGPLFAYLVSPAARKTGKAHAEHAEHAEHHKEPEKEEVTKVEITDDEGTTADVTTSIAAAESTDAPKSADAETPATKEAEPEAEPESKPEGESAPQSTAGNSSKEERDAEATPNDLQEVAKQPTSGKAPKQVQQEKEETGESPKTSA